MSFQSDIDNISILERNASRLNGLQMEEARKMLAQYRIAKEDLKLQMLSNSPTNEYTEAKLKNTLAQIDVAIANLRIRTGKRAKEGFEFLTDQGLEDSVREMDSFDKYFGGGFGKLPYDAIIESTDPEQLLFNQYDSSVNMYSMGLRNAFQQTLTQSLIQQKTWSQAVWDMEQVFGMEEWKLARIVRTELHGIYNNSKMNGFMTIREDYVPDLKKTLYNPMDSRTAEDSLYVESLKLIVPLDQPFRYKWKGQEYIGMAPPFRPNDRAILIPYRPKFDT